MYKAHINDKKVQSCQEHCINTANYARKYTESVKLGNTAYLCGLLHDVGKCTDEFNEYIETASSGKKVNRGSIIHTFAGLKMVLQKYHSYYNHSIEKITLNNLTSELIAIAIGSHHGQFDVYNAENKSGFDHRLKKQPVYDKKAIENYYRECISIENIDMLFEKSARETEEIYHKIFDLLTETDDDKKYEEILFYLGILERILLSALIDGDCRDTAEFMSNSEIRFQEISENELISIWQDSHAHLIKKLDTFAQLTEIQRIRREFSDYCEKFAENSCGIYRLNLPTGAGKTLSSLRYAIAHAKKYHKKHIIFAIPLLSILDQNATVIREAVGNDGLILEHHSNVIIDDISDEKNQRRELLTETWDSPIIITTLVQLLNTMFDGRKSSIRRFHRLVDSVIVMDEVQSVPTRMLSLFNMTLNFLSKICNTTFLLCSATQPLLEMNSHKLLISKSEIVSADKLQKYKDVFKRTDVQYIGELNYDEIVQQIDQYFRNCNSVLVICNTKKEAYELFIKVKILTDSCIHLSTSMCMAHRRSIITEMTKKLENKEPLICISTQLIEAGVDVSFGAVIRLAAGIDSVVQAAGRANRNGELEKPAPVGIAFLKGEDLSKLKEIKLSQDVTGELIAEYKKRPDDFERNLISDSSVNYYYERLFSRINAVQHYTDYCVKDGNLFDYLSCNAHNTQNISEKDTDIIMRHAFKTAGDKFEVFSDTQFSLVVPYGDGKEIINEILSDKFAVDIVWAKKIIKDANEYIVDLYDYQIKKLNECGAIYFDKNKTVWILNPDYYDSQLGVITEKGDENRWNILIL